MCGLAGYFVWDEAPPSLEEATLLLRHRGPDAVGTWTSPSGEVGLAHTRLSILDLSEAAHQPLHYLHTHIVYNGEVYNFRQLAQGGNFSLHTRSDTEVLLHAYLRWGEVFLEKLEGMFAFALYDEQKHTLLLARDPFGIKPLWVAVQEGGIYFASELKVLRAWLRGLSVRKGAIAEFLHLGFIPAPGSWYEGVYKVLPGESWWIRPKHIQRRIFYDRERLGRLSLSFRRVEEAEEV
ncbi:MAG: asparagine synthetase B, partial [Bacteroidia bacterium]|nr:asparagine synthetase B [Bacteroidia bacterium]MDW8236644.1 asparagine synthetase B [Bacteroidia bacterium]